MSKYFLVNNKQEWGWLMQKFEEKDSEIRWLLGQRPSCFHLEDEDKSIGNEIVIEFNDSEELSYQTREYFMDYADVTPEQFIEVGKLMEGENHG